MDDDFLKIQGRYRAEFEKAKLYQQRAWLMDVGIALSALISLLVDPGTLTYLFSILALVLTILKRYISYRSSDFRGIAERAIRLLTLTNGLGYKVSKNEIVDLKASFNVSEAEGRNWEDPNYFSSTQDKGYERFAEILLESVFFSKFLFKESARQTWTWFIGVFSISILAMFILVSYPSQETISAILILLVSIDLLGRALSFTEASNSLTRIFDRAKHFDSPKFDQHDLIYLWGDYNAIIQNTPLIPTGIYDKHKERLTNLFKQL
mgnify:CR=1 FL=1